jgi:hypothetical protein
MRPISVGIEMDLVKKLNTAIAMLGVWVRYLR